MLTFATPIGFLALLAIPAILAIHFLRARPREIEVSTLFLLPDLKQATNRGTRFRLLELPPSIWLQLLAALLIALLLAGPRWYLPVEAQRIAIVLDDTASMAPYREDALERLRAIAEDAAGRARTTDWALLTSGGARLYVGDSVSAMLTSATNWQPRASQRDVSDAFALARTLAGAQGFVFFLTDHPASDADDILWNAVGEPIPNIGISGIRAEADQWSAIIRNYGSEPAERRWRVRPESETDAAWQSIELSANGSRTVTGKFPPHGEGVWIELEPDAFSIDDRAAIARPSGKPITVAAADGAPELASRAAALFETRRPAEATAPDIVIDAWSPLEPGLPQGNAILFIADEGARTEPIDGELIAVNDPLMEGLNWGALVAGAAFDFPEAALGRVLLWADERPLISERRTEESRQLLFHFDPATSNLARLPAFPVLLHRWVDRVVWRFDRPFTGNFETGQKIEGQASLPTAQAPATPQFFQLPTGPDTPLIRGGAHFADAREADFSGAVSQGAFVSELPRDPAREARARTPGALLGLLLAALILGSWYLAARET